ncbi:tetratricopeptide repeat protein [Anaerocolumna xylanovorans]|uniref:Tetratricopeptide repeat-containing protein n=1 Tax=Anaerocolumna xylanovorans DSM 12503 TaxID=1121345 RepID=A0A1M7Y9E8_9FIRM|nr:tetratricopeptide repeat protein [Anaerocolumna xylanovorans]SHO49265.1 Tetratricopeptide repeat-containing protein [Anaerocolumna xylanovorans DSM 12503]
MPQNKVLNDVMNATEKVLDIAGLFSGNIGIQLLAKVPSVMQKCIYGLGWIKSDLTKEINLQLLEVIHKTFKGCSNRINYDSVNRLLILLEPRIEYEWKQGFTYVSMEKWLKDALMKEETNEQLYLNAFDLNQFLSIFINEFKLQLSGFKELSTYIQFQILDDMDCTLKDHETRIESLEKTLLHTKESSIYTLSVNTALDQDYIDRAMEKDTIRTILNSSSYLMLSGIGGIGKSETLKSIYLDYVSISNSKDSPYKLGFMIYQDSMDFTVYQSMLIKKTGNYDEDLRTAWMRLYELGDKNNCILFIDNINNTLTKDNSLNKLYSFHGKVVITSRFRTLDKFKVLEIEPLSDNNCRQLFISKFTGVITNNDVFDRIIFNYAKKHTKTIGLLASIASDNNWTLEQLEEQLIKNKFNMDYCSGFEYANMQMEYEKLFAMANLNTQEINVLEAFALLPNQPIEGDLCLKLLGEDAKCTSNLLFTMLYRKGWLERKKTGYYMHPIISDTLYARKPILADAHSNLIIAIHRELEEDKYRINKGSLSSTMIYADSICRKINQEYKEDLYDLMFDIAHTYSDLYLLADARTYINMLEALAGNKGNTTLGKIKLLCAQISSTDSDFMSAIDYAKEALSLLHDDYETLFMAKLFIIQQYLFISNFKMASVKLNRLLKEIPESSSFTNTLFLKIILAYSLSQQGENEALIIADELYDVLLADDQLARNIRSKFLDNLSVVYGRQSGNDKYLSRALKLKQESLEIFSTIYGAESVDVGISYVGIGEIYHSLKKYGLSEEYYHKAEKIYLKELDNKHFNIAILYYNIGNLYIDMGKYYFSIKYLEAGRAIIESKSLPETDFTKTFYSELGLAYARYGNAKEAQRYMEKAGYNVTVSPNQKILDIQLHDYSFRNGPFKL